MASVEPAPRKTPHHPCPDTLGNVQPGVTMKAGPGHTSPPMGGGDPHQPPVLMRPIKTPATSPRSKPAPRADAGPLAVRAPPLDLHSTAVEAMISVANLLRCPDGHQALGEDASRRDGHHAAEAIASLLRWASTILLARPSTSVRGNSNEASLRLS